MGQFQIESDPLLLARHQLNFGHQAVARAHPDLARHQGPQFKRHPHLVRFRV